ncbi:ABC transporter permease, partial [Thermococci archaeon]
LISQMQDWGKIIASFSPLTYFTDLVSYCTQETSYYSIPVDFIALIGFTLLFLTAAIKIHKKTLPKRLS